MQHIHQNLRKSFASSLKKNTVINCRKLTKPGLFDDRVPLLPGIVHNQ